MRFDPEDARKIAIIEGNGVIRWIQIAWDVEVSQSMSRLTSVIDNDSIRKL